MPDQLTERVCQLIANTQKIPLERVTIDSTFEELGIDSMDGVNIMFAVESEFDVTIPDEAAKTIRSVRQMVEGIESLRGGGTESAAAAV